jgi:hypothetical protein
MTKIFLFFLLTAMFLTSCKTSNKSTSTDNATNINSVPPNLVGTWKSPTPEFAGNGHYAVREFSFNGPRMEHTFTLAADKDMKKIIYIYRVEGSVELGSPSTKVAGAFDLQIKPSKKLVTLKTKDKLTIEDIGFKECKLTTGKEKDISSSGCSVLRSINECSVEYDLVKIEGEQLRLGERPVDNEVCSPENRPEMLASGLKKVN